MPTNKKGASTPALPERMTYARALDIVAASEVHAIRTALSQRGLDDLITFKVIAAARKRTATTCDLCAAHGVATIIPAGHAAVNSHGSAACPTCVASPLWAAAVRTPPERLRERFQAEGLI